MVRTSAGHRIDRWKYRSIVDHAPSITCSAGLQLIKSIIIMHIYIYDDDGRPGSIRHLACMSLMQCNAEYHRRSMSPAGGRALSLLTDEN